MGGSMSLPFDGASFIARRDNRSLSGWWLAVVNGGRLDKVQPRPSAKKGDSGERGEPAVIIGWQIDRERYRVTRFTPVGKPGAALNRVNASSGTTTRRVSSDIAGLWNLIGELMMEPGLVELRAAG